MCVAAAPVWQQPDEPLIAFFYVMILVAFFAHSADEQHLTWRLAFSRSFLLKLPGVARWLVELNISRRSILVPMLIMQHP